MPQTNSWSICWSTTLPAPRAKVRRQEHHADAAPSLGKVRGASIYVALPAHGGYVPSSQAALESFGVRRRFCDSLIHRYPGG